MNRMHTYTYLNNTWYCFLCVFTLKRQHAKNLILFLIFLLSNAMLLHSILFLYVNLTADGLHITTSALSHSLLQGVFSELSLHRFVPGWFWGLHQEQTAKAKDMILPLVVQEGSHFPASLSILGTNKISNFWQPDDFEVDHTVIEICISLITSEMASLRVLLSNLDFSSELPKSFVFFLCGFPLFFLPTCRIFLGH